MLHSVKGIGQTYEEFSTWRKGEKQFSAAKFFQFAKDNMKKYQISENGDDLLVSTFHSDALIEGYKKTLMI